MAEYKYTSSSGRLASLMSKIRQIGLPEKATTKWLQSVGFGSSNDSTFISILKQINFIDESGVPTDNWTEYRSNNHNKVLGKCIKEGYEDLYKIFPNAHDKIDSELKNYFSTHTKGGKRVIQAILGTYRSLVHIAEFDEEDKELEGSIDSDPQPNTDNKVAFKPTVHIDLQIHISPETSPEKINEIFEAIAKHLYGKNTE